MKMKSLKMMLAAVIAAAMCAAMTGCGENSGSSIVDTGTTSTESIDNANSVSETENISADSSKAEAAGDSSYIGVNPDELVKDENGNYPIDQMKLVPDAEVTHPDANFGTIMFQENELDMFNLPHSEFINITHASRSRSTKFTYNTNTFYFKGQAFGRGLTNPQIFLEYLTTDNTLLYASSDHLEDEKYDDTISLKGFAFLEEMAKDEYDYIRFYEGIQLHMRRDEIEAILGEGIVGNDTDNDIVLYKSNTETMVIVYVTTDEYVGMDAAVANAIYVIKND